MTIKPDEPYHRQWLHAIEDDRSVPGTAMQVARIFADYAASRGGTDAGVSWAALQRQTHRSTDAIDQAIKYLITYEWLEPHPRKNGQRAIYSLTLGKPSHIGKPLRLPEWSGSGNHSDYRSATTPTTGVEPLRLPECERHTSVTSLSREERSLHAALSAVVSDATERDTQLTLAEIKNQPGVRNAVAVMRTEIKNGTIRDRVTKIRSAANPAQMATTMPPLCGKCDNRWIEDDHGRAMHCPRCHPQAREPQPS